MSDAQYRLLGPHDPAPVERLRPKGQSPFVLTCEHAGKVFPKRLDQLGLTVPDLERHITYDIGAEGVALGISERLDAPLILQRYSRLVVDCNRAPHADDFIIERSETTPIPGNYDVSEMEATARAKEIFDPYHDTIRELLDEREAAQKKTILVSVHTCTPVYHGVSRPWHIGVMYDKDDRFARIVLGLLQEHGELTVGENEPYELTHERDYTVPVHGELRNLPHVEFEVRQDLVTTEAGQIEWSDRLADVLREGLGRLRENGHL
ncbi:MAG: N-formylglutamate amidohydrolase [Gammaproteobacteria bacterium]|nr:N-formylglutamate amidohydrolase [Gammaproteobacteria bacterium]